MNNPLLVRCAPEMFHQHHHTQHTPPSSHNMASVLLSLKNAVVHPDTPAAATGESSGAISPNMSELHSFEPSSSTASIWPSQSQEHHHHQQHPHHHHHHHLLFSYPHENFEQVRQRQ